LNVVDNARHLMFLLNARNKCVLSFFFD